MQLKDKLDMASKTPVVSSLNPNAPAFVPAAQRAVVGTHVATAVAAPVEAAVAPVVEDFSSEWWNLVQTNPAFRETWLNERYPGFDDQDSFVEDLNELADLDEFLEYQDQLQESEVKQALLDLDDDFYLDDELTVTANGCRDVKGPKQQLQWCKQDKHHGKIPNKVANFPKKANTYHRIQQPQAVM